jgi:PAS domain-containing protein
MTAPGHDSNAADAVAAYRKRLAGMLATVDIALTNADPALPSAATVLLEDTVAELQVTEEELRAQNDALLDARFAVEARGVEFQLLFEYAPVAYLVTDHYGAIRDANIAATQLLRRAKNALIGKPLPVFVAPERRAAFRAALSHACAGAKAEEWPMRLQSPGTEPVDVILTVGAGPTYGSTPGSTSLYWLLRPDGRRDTEDLP